MTRPANPFEHMTDDELTTRAAALRKQASQRNQALHMIRREQKRRQKAENSR